MGQTHSRNVPLESLQALDYTYVLYDPTQPLAAPLALFTLSPFFLFSSYATLLLINRPLSVANIFVGQLGNEVLNWVLKHWLRADRPGVLGDGYGMPSSHSQFVAYASTFQILHILLIQNRRSTGLPLLTHPTPTIRFTRVFLLFGLTLWAGLTGYSRYYLSYHTAGQVIAGLGLGIVTGAAHFLVTEAVPFWYPQSVLGRGRNSVRGVWESWPIEGFGGWGPNGAGRGSSDASESDGARRTSKGMLVDAKKDI